MSRKAAAALFAGLVLCAPTVAPAPALASHGQVTYFQADRELLNPRTRNRTFSQLASLGVRAVRLVMTWGTVAPHARSSRRPRFDATNPRAYTWGNYDAVVAGARRRGWKLMLDVSGPVPRWATPGGRDTLTRPNALAFEKFMTAAGRHYGTLVDTWAIWNEPNHPRFLLPQFGPGHRPASPRIYRGLVQGAVAGLHAAGLAHPRVIIGDTAPVGTRHELSPLGFLRGTLCLSPSYHRSRSCSTLDIQGIAHHPYTTIAGPFFRPHSRDDVTIGVLSRLVRAVDLAGRAGAIPPHLPIYLTEFGIQSKPNPFLGVSLAQQAEFQEISEHLAWVTPQVAGFSQYLLRDDPHISRPGSSLRGGVVGFQTGLELKSGRAKPAFAGFRLPLVLHRRGATVSLWGEVRPARVRTTVQIQTLDGRSRRWRSLLTAHTDGQGYWGARSSFRRGRRWRVRWVAGPRRVYVGPAIRAY